MLTQDSEKNQVFDESGFGEAGSSKTRLDSQTTTHDSNEADKTPEEFRIEVKPDWAQFTGQVEASKLFEITNLLEAATNEQLLTRKKSVTIGREFKYSARSPRSLTLAWSDIDIDKRIDCLISIPGKVLAAMECSQIWMLMSLLVEMKLRCTRLDIALDDWSKTLDPSKINAALAAGNYAYFKSKRFVSKYGDDFTYYFGSSESPRSTKFYNKHAESKGKIKSYRLETRFGSKVAHQVLMHWLAIKPIKDFDDAWEKQSAKYLIKSVVGSVDFLDRQSKPEEKNLNRLKRLDWWQEFIDKLKIEEGIHHTRQVPNPSLERSTTWLRRQVFRSLACVLTAFGAEAKEWIVNQLEEATGTLRERHQNLISQFRIEYEMYKSNPNVSFV